MAAPVARETGTGAGTNVASFNITITTAQTDYILLLAVYNEHTGTAAATVSSVTSAGMTWALRRRSNGSTTGGLELWWAHGTGALSLYNITANMTGTYDNAAGAVVVVTGCANPAAPFDTNASLPKALSAPTGTWTPSFTAVSTSSTDDLLFYITGAIGGGGTPGGSFTQLVRRTNGGGSWSAVSEIDVASVTALQTNATFTYGSALTNPFGAQSCGEAIFDALAGNLPAAGGSQARVMVMA